MESAMISYKSLYDYYLTMAVTYARGDIGLTPADIPALEVIANECANGMLYAMEHFEPFHPPAKQLVLNRLEDARHEAQYHDQDRDFPNHLNTKITKLKVKPKLSEVFEEVLSYAAEMEPLD